MKKGVIGVLSLLTGIIGITIKTELVMKKKISKEKYYAEKHLALFLMMNQWVKIKQEGKNLATYFKNYNFNKIAIYGVSYAGETLIEELKDTGVEVVYGIDRNADKISHFIKIVSTEDKLEKVDAVIVTAITSFNDIRDMLSEKIECPVISLENILYEI